MFNGIIRNTGQILKTSLNGDLTVLEIASGEIARDIKTGDSIAVDGACLTATAVTDETFSADVMPESIKKTIIGGYRTGDIVNLETPLRLGDKLDGHPTGGHIDYAGTVQKIIRMDKTFTLAIELPPDFRKFFAVKGSVAVNGISLTVSELDTGSFSVCIIPETQRMTNIGNLREGSKVNIETDMFARYTASLLDDMENRITYSFLRERNFI